MLLSAAGIDKEMSTDFNRKLGQKMAVNIPPTKDN